MNNKKSKICFMGKLAAIAIFGTMLSAVPYFNRDINKVCAVGPGEEEKQEEFSGELDAAALEILYLNPKYCNYAYNGTKVLFVPDGFDSVASDVFEKLSADVKNIALPYNIVKKLDFDKVSSSLKDIFICIHKNEDKDKDGNINFNSYFFLDENMKISCAKLNAPLISLLANNPKYAPDGPKGTFIVPPWIQEVNPNSFLYFDFSKVEYTTVVPGLKLRADFF